MLRKRTPLVFSPGQRAVPGAPARVVCEPVPSGPPPRGGTGSWVTECSTTCVLVPPGDGDGSIAMGSGNGNLYVCGLPVCKTVWRSA